MIHYIYSNCQYGGDNSSSRVVLCCVALCCVGVLCCAVLCYVMLCHVNAMHDTWHTLLQTCFYGTMQI